MRSPWPVIEKGKVCGAHNLSGAVMKPGPLKSLFPDEDLTELAAVRWVNEKDDVWWLTEKGTARCPAPPRRNFQNEGNWVISLSQLCRFLAEKAEESAPTSSPRPQPPSCSSRTARPGHRHRRQGPRARKAKKLGNFEPGMEVHARQTVLAEGNWGHLTGAAIKHFNLAEGQSRRLEARRQGSLEDHQAVGHRRPLLRLAGRGNAKWHETGVGGGVYPYGENQVSIGIVAPLATPDATVSAHDMSRPSSSTPS